MTGQQRTWGGRAVARSAGYSFLLPFAFLLGSAQAQAPAPPGSTTLVYTWQTAFKLPVKIEDAERARLSAIQLFVRPGPGAQWVCQEAASAAQREFLFRAPQDGEYDFNMVLVEPSGRRTPADLNREAPELIVVVDTQPPEGDLQLVTAASGDLLVQCQVRDANPDASKTRLEWQTSLGGWQALAPHADYPGCFRIPSPQALRGKLRYSVFDRAGNSATRMVNGSSLRILTSTDSAQQLASSQSQKVGGGIRLSPAGRGAGGEGAAPAGVIPASAQQPTDAPPNLQIVNRKHVALAYSLEDVGFHGVGKVEVWMTADRGESWQKIGEDADRRSPADFDLPGEGVFGVSLVVSNASGYGGVPPARGEAPDWWVEVDLTKPQARLLELRPGASRDDLGTYQIIWTAADKNLKPQPISFYYARRREGPWLPIAKGLANSGSYRWQVPHGALTGTVYVTMEVADVAGNVTYCELPQGVVVDLARPKARVLGVASSPEQGMPAGN